MEWGESEGFPQHLGGCREGSRIRRALGVLASGKGRKGGISMGNGCGVSSWGNKVLGRGKGTGVPR